MQNKILELERKIQEDKRLLDAMSKNVYEGYSYSLDFVKAKLSSMESDIGYMEQQIAILRRDIEEQPVNSINKYVNAEDISLKSNIVTVKENMYTQTDAVVSEEDMYLQPYRVTAYMPPRKDMEAAVGKTIMGVAASVLIFISLVLFATLIIPQLTDGIRLGLMYIISVGITIFGLLKLNKARDSVLFLSVSACGVGSIFISLFLSNVYFNLFNEIALYVLLLLWAAGVCVLSRLRSSVFNVIGQAGILISVFFGVVFCGNVDEFNKMFMIIIYFVVGSLIFYFTHIQNKKSYIMNNIFNLISTFILIVGVTDLKWYYEFNEETAPMLYGVAFGVIVAYTLLMLILPLVWSGNNENKNFTLLQKYADGTGVLSAAYYFAFSFALDGLVRDDWFFGITLIIAPVYLFVVEYIRRKYTESAGINVLYVFLTIMLAGSMENTYYFYLMFGLSLLIVPYILYGFLFNKRIFKIMALVLMLAFAVDESMNIVMWIIFGIIIFGGSMYFALTKKEQYKPIYKNLIFILVLIFVTTVMSYFDYTTEVNEAVIECIYFVILAVIVAIAVKSRFVRNTVTQKVEKGTKLFLNIIIGCLMIFNLGQISYVDDVFLQIIYIIFAIGIFMLNAVEQINNKDRAIYGAYVGFKFTALMVVMLSSFNSENFIISIFCFLFAIVSIIIGFILKHKILRIYGLVLSLVSVVKLVMIDITYDNTLGHAVSFFISGVLCFVISAIYTGVEKKMEENE